LIPTISAAGGSPRDDSRSAQQVEPSLAPRIQQVWRTHISPPQAPSQSQDESFRRILEVLKSVRFKSSTLPKLAQGREDSDASAPTTQPVATRPVELPEQTLSDLKKACQSGSVDEALVAEALRLAGFEVQAAQFYAEAARKSTDKDAQGYLLFLAANCLRASDRTAASKYFEELIKDHDGTIWADLAKVQNRIIQWQQVNKVASLLESALKESGKI